ncbi:MAG: AAA family ATPase [Anaerolineae bacterium]|jgi:dephospho-CoA kinase|nr:AAA family ATPase [Anaerolineae bacterium]
MPARSLALVGMPGSGKTLCATHLEQQGYYQFRFGSIVENEVIRRGLVVNPANERVIREEFRAHDGMDAIAKRALPHLQTALESHDHLVIDGLYSWSEYKLLRGALGTEMILVAIACERARRYQRLAARPIRPLTIEQAEQRDWAEIENLEKGGPIAIADFTLINNDSPEALLALLDNLMRQLDFRP